MSVRMRALLARGNDELRYEPTDRRVRATLGGVEVVDSTRALLVWEPHRVVPTYAVPADDVRGALVAAPPAPVPAGPVRLPELGGRARLDPRVSFAVHTCDGEPLEIQAAGQVAAAFRPADQDLAGYVILDFAGFDAWWEEDDRVESHPRDPFHRIDVLASSRHVRIELGGEVIADTARAHLLFETMLPIRYYLPVEDVRVPLRASATRTTCAYKGRAEYYSAELAGGLLDDIAWEYRTPLPDAVPVQGLVAFFHERLDLVLDDVPQDRVLTPWSHAG